MNSHFLHSGMESGRPEDISGRSCHEIQTYALLERLGIPFCRADHEPAATIADCGEVDALFGTPMCKNLFLTNRQQTAFYLLLLPGDKPFRTKELSAQIGSARLSFGDEEHMTALLGVRPGAVTPLGLQFDTEKRVKLLIDRDVARERFVCCHPCANTSSVRIAAEDFLGKLLPGISHIPDYVEL